MTTDDFMLDQVERSQRQQTRRRRDHRSRRHQLYLFGGLAFVLMMLLVAPSIVSHSSIGRSILVKALRGYGLDGDVDSVRVGWITPLRLTGLRVHGSAGSEVSVDQLDMDFTVTDLWGNLGNELGEIAARGVTVSCEVSEGRCSLEDDLNAFLGSSQEPSNTSALLKLQDISLSIADVTSGAAWQIAQSNADVEISPERTVATFAGVLSEPNGSGGSLQGVIDMAGAEGRGESGQWRLDIDSESLPLSVVSLLRRRFPETGSSIPQTIHGDATGTLRIVGTSDGAIEMAVRGLKVRNLTAAEQGSRVWNNGLATLDGDLLLVGNRIIGRQLKASTDFGAATIDAAFSRTYSLVGANDNPLRWLEAIEGTATAEIDLAAFDRSLPGILPLRDEAQIKSGRAVARVDSSIAGGVRRSQLNLRSDALRALAHGRAVVIDPIELNATVSRHQGQLRAERFEWKSTFGSAIGQGDLRSGNADFDVDFGRLTAMLRPIVQISETTLAGIARGNVQWNASDDDVWRLSGSGYASNLLITLPGGQSLKRPSIEGEVEAVGRWGGESLDELTRAKITLGSSGLDLQAELVNPVPRPSAIVPMPIQIRGSGRIETLVDALGPWLPTPIHSASGGFTLNAVAEASTLTTRLTNAALELTQPRIAYGERHFSQPAVKVHFDGDYALPSNALQARSITVAGDAFSMAAKGDLSPDHANMEVKWRAKLERIQGSVRKRIANRNSTIQQVGYRPGTSIDTEDWLVMGDCEGAFVVTHHDKHVNIDVDALGSGIAVVQPPRESAGFQTVGPMPQRAATGNLARDSQSRVVWSEPNLKINGSFIYDPATGGMIADAMQVAGDWFATTLSGRVLWNERAGDVQLDGPARLKMNEVAHRLSSLAGTSIHAQGIQETPLHIRVRRQNNDIALAITANLGWESGEIAGVVFGPASVPVRLTETSVEIAPSRIPVGQGNLNLAGQVHYRPGPLWMRLEPGVVAESIRLTPEMTDRWLKYLAPLAADAARIDGSIGAEIDQAVIVFEQPEQSRASGRLNIDGVQMVAGPMANQILGGVDQLKSLARNVTAPSGTRNDRELITMPAQTVDFSVDRGIVTHDRLFFEIDRAQVVTSGRVSLDGRLDMIAQVPLDARWLGSDLQGMAGQPVTLPINGTLSRPNLDSSDVRQVVTRLGVQAVQSTAENYLQQQLNRGIDKIFGR